MFSGGEGPDICFSGGEGPDVQFSGGGEPDLCYCFTGQKKDVEGFQLESRWEESYLIVNSLREKE